MRREVRRGRRFVEYLEDNGKHTQEICAGDINYLDNDGTWKPIDLNWKDDGSDGFAYCLNKLNYKVRFDSIGAWRWYPRRNVETEYVVIGRPQCWLEATKRWGNLLVNGISRDGGNITLTSMRNVTRIIHSRWNGIKTDYILENGNAPKRYRYPVELVGIIEQDGLLYGADGEMLGLLTPTIAQDADDKNLPCTSSYSDGYVEFQVDTEGATYPITVDPDFVGGTGDGYIIGKPTNETSSSANVTTTTMNCGFTGNGTTLKTCTRIYLLFDTSSIPDDTNISQVNLKLTAYSAATIGQNGAHFDVLIKKYNWGGLTLTDADDRETAYDGCKSATADDNIWQNSEDLSANTQYPSGNLSTAWINKTGYTYYALIGSNDQNNDGDDYVNGGQSYVTICSANHATEAYRPILVVSYGEASTGAVRIEPSLSAIALGNAVRISAVRKVGLLC